MLNRAARAVRRARPVIERIGQRGMATEAQLKSRMKVVGNIGKITKAMKMVSAAKVKAVQNQLDIVRVFAKSVTAVWNAPEQKEAPAKPLYVVITADRGLCGSVNSSIVSKARADFRKRIAEKKDFAIITYGDKGRNGLERLFPTQILTSYGDGYKTKLMNFKQVLIVTDELLDNAPEQVNFIYNRFKNMLTFETTTETVPSLAHMMATAPDTFMSYEVENGGGYPEMLENLYEFRLACRWFQCLQEMATSEQSARMNAMSNSSKAANDMLNALQLEYNRKRQDRITTELVEIVSGAAAVDNAKTDA